MPDNPSAQDAPPLRTFVTIKWKAPDADASYLRRGGRETAYDHRNVNAICGMLRRVYGDRFRMICVTDDAEGLDRAVIPFLIGDEQRRFIREFSGRFFKLFLYSREFADFVGADFIYTDLDVVIAGDIWYAGPADIAILQGFGAETEGRLGPLAIMRRSLGLLRRGRFRELADFLRYPRKIWCRFNSSYVFLRHGTCHDLWERFDQSHRRAILEQNRIVGTDQAWLHFNTDDRFAVVGPDDGFFRIGQLRQKGSGASIRRQDIRFVAFPGEEAKKPWNATAPDQFGLAALYRSHFVSAAEPNRV